MHSSHLLEMLALNVPLLAGVGLVVWLQIYPRLWVAVLLGVLWQLAVLPWLNLFAQRQGWWSFSSPVEFLGMPLSLYFGWVLWWGVVAVIAMGKLPFRGAVWVVAGAMLVFDLIAMPLLNPVVDLGRYWYVGELVLIVFGLGPGLWLAHVTLLDRTVRKRSLLIAFAFVVVMLAVLPLADGRSLSGVVEHVTGRSWIGNLGLMAGVFFAGVPGIAGVVEFARVGRGTPIPFDPPRRLVTSGVYAYIANPMQTSAVVVLLVWAWFIHSWLCVAIAAVAVIYSLGIAAWSEGRELYARFESDWKRYQGAVRTWTFRLFPYRASESSEAKLYVAMSCAPCSEIARWFLKRDLIGLRIEDAADWDGAPLKRITYAYPDGRTAEQGVAAIACALQHLHLGWAWLGWMIQVPGIHGIAQRAIDTTLPYSNSLGSQAGESANTSA